MSKAQKVYEFIELNDFIPIQTLPVKDQLRVLFKSMFSKKENRLKADDAVTKEMLTLESDLTEFFNRALKPLRSGDESKVTMEVDSRFLPVFKSVRDNMELIKYYKVSESIPKVEYDFLEYTFLVRFETRVAR